jgi:hypothetical protein
MEFLRDARWRADERAKLNHERFNVFTTLLDLGDEVFLHTRFLHCLLDPNGHHDCGSKFLNLFFETLSEHPPLNHDASPATLSVRCVHPPWAVGKEVACDSGRIDLLLAQPDYGIAIENKIFAREQDEQLACYSEHLLARYGKGFVLFLTLDGRASATHKGSIPYYRISYSTHVLVWLEKCLRETYDIVPVNQVLQQYRSVVRALIGETMESEIVNAVAEFAAQHPEIIRCRRQFDVGIAVARANFLERYAQGITNGLAEFRVTRYEHLPQKEFGTDPNGALVISPPEGSPLRRAPFAIWLQHIDQWNAVLLGIVVDYNRLEGGPETSLMIGRVSDVLGRNLRGCGQVFVPGPRPTWIRTYSLIGSIDLINAFNDDKLADLMDPRKKPFADLVTEQCAAIRNYCRQLESAYTEITVSMTASIAV